jgi:hypothetical protein
VTSSHFATIPATFFTELDPQNGLAKDIYNESWVMLRRQRQWKKVSSFTSWPHRRLTMEELQIFAKYMISNGMPLHLRYSRS